MGFEPLGHGGPRIERRVRGDVGPLRGRHVRRVGHDRAAGSTAGIDGGRHRVVPVRIARGHHRAEVVVTEGEGVGQRVVERQVATRVVAHGERAPDSPVARGVRDGPLIHATAVPRQVLHLPFVTDVVGAGAAAPGRVQVERKQPTRRRAGGSTWIDLGEDARITVRVIVEASTRRIGAEVVVVRAVLLDEDHDVFDLAQIGMGGRNREVVVRDGQSGQAGQRSRPGVQRGAGAEERGVAKEVATVDGVSGHGATTRSAMSARPHLGVATGRSDHPRLTIAVPPFAGVAYDPRPPGTS